MGSREDDAYWDDKYAADVECEDHGSGEMYYDEDEAEWVCLLCEDLDEFQEILRGY